MSGIDAILKMVDLQIEVDILRNKGLSLGEMIGKLEKCSQDAEIYIKISNHDDFIQSLHLYKVDYEDQIMSYGRTDYREDFTVGDFKSYRGYYQYLSIVPSTSRTTVSEVLEKARNCIGKVFEGYKGGDFLMTEDTFIWCSDWRYSDGLLLVDVSEKDSYVDLIFKYVEKLS